MSAIGILGGTFDPIHIGHIHMAERIYRQLDLCEIRFIPCAQSPHKTKPIATAAQRLNMLNLALKPFAHFCSDSRELNRPGISYTIDTVRSLTQEFPRVKLCILMSDDAFRKFNTWYKWKEILMLAHIIVANRTTTEVLSTEMLEILQKHQIYDHNKLDNLDAGCIMRIDISPLDISATQIRAAIRAKKDISTLLPNDVWSFIKNNKIYL